MAAERASPKDMSLAQAWTEADTRSILPNRFWGLDYAPLETCRESTSLFLEYSVRYSEDTKEMWRALGNEN